MQTLRHRTTLLETLLAADDGHERAGDGLPRRAVGALEARAFRLLFLGVLLVFAGGGGVALRRRDLGHAWMSGVQLGACEVRALRGDGVLLEEMRQQVQRFPEALVSAATQELTSVIDILGFHSPAKRVVALQAASWRTQGHSLDSCCRLLRYPRSWGFRRLGDTAAGWVLITAARAWALRARINGDLRRRRRH